MCHFSVDGMRIKTPFSTGITIAAKDWNSEQQQMKGKHYAAQNETLKNINTQITQLFNAMVLNGVAVSAEKLKETYLVGVKPPTCLLSFLTSWLAKQEPTPQADGKPSTNQLRKLHFEKKLKVFLKKTDQTAILLEDVTEKLFVNFAHYLRHEAVFVSKKKQVKGYSAEVVKKNLNLLKNVMEAAYVQELVSRKRIEHCEFADKDKPKEFIFLTKPEIDLLASFKFANQSLQRVADLFVFQCYTGFAYSDLCSFTSADLVMQNGKQWIVKNRDKGQGNQSQKALLPFFVPARKLWQHYAAQLPLLSNGKYNLYIKEACHLCGIGKHITTHTARRTAAMLFFESGIDEATVAAMVGHATATTTRKYYIRNRMERMEKQLEGKLEW